jgi:RNA recognition motif-containing protein
MNDQGMMTDASYELNPAKLFVGNISWSASEEDLKAAFSEAGTVVYVRIIKDKQTGRSKGYGFVEMSSGPEAEKAIELLNGKDLAGRAISVNVAKPMERR